jgi:hypothetical protein
VHASVAQVADGAWALFPDSILLKGGETYVARLKAGICDVSTNCTSNDVAWSFTVAPEEDQASGETTVPAGFWPASEALLCRRMKPDGDCELMLAAPPLVPPHRARKSTLLSTVRSSKPLTPRPKEKSHVSK